MRRTLTAAAAAALALGLVAGPAAAKPDRAGPPAWAGPGLETTIVETAVALSDYDVTDPLSNLDDNSGDFDILVTAVILTNTTDLLDGTEDYTVFAPTDQAFIDVANTLSGGDLSEAEAALFLVDALGASLGDVLAYHVTEDWRPSPSVLNAKKIEMLAGGTISGKTGQIVANNSTANIVLPDVKTADGGIHVIDAVLLP